MSPRALTGLEGARVGDRFLLQEALSAGFTSQRYLAVADGGEKWLLTLIDSTLSATAPTAISVAGELARLAGLTASELNLPSEAGIDEALGCAYFAERLPSGRTLALELAEKGQLDSRAALRLLAGLATALAPLHRAGLSHRAITADSIFVERKAEKLVARLAGFADGVAQPNSAAIELDRDARLAPEIADGLRGDARADVWALAAVLHETASANTDEQLTGLLAKCLDDDPEKRPRDAAAFMRLLALPLAAGSRTDEGGVSLDATVEGNVAVAKFIGDYEIISLLGEGGMGAVYEVRDKAGDRFALKVIRGEGKGHRERRRFVREVKAASGLKSEHVTRVLSSGVDSRTGAPFMVMELLAGTDLATAIKRDGALEAGVAARIAADACLGLAEAHSAGLIHRDIKPPNLFLHQVDGNIVTKVCDFGIVKATALNQANTVLTRTGALIGSPSYMSPEQAQDSSVVDSRTDIWSLSATLYEMLAGVSPWDGAKNVGEILVLLHTRDVPPIREIAPWVDEAMAEVVHRGLARDPAERFQSASELREALLPFAATSPLTVSALKGIEQRALPRTGQARSGATSTVLHPATSQPAPARRWLAAALGAAAVATIGIATWRYSRPDAAIPPPGSSAIAAESPCELSSCIASNGGKPSRCRRDGACVALETEQCHVLADAEALANPNTIWLGTMFPRSDSDPFFAAFGLASERAIDLARRDFASVGGLPARGAAPAQAVAVVACDDSADAAAAAKHLVSVGVPAVIGFRSSKDVIQLSQVEFIPNDILVVPALNTSSLIASIPHPPQSARLVFRTAVTNTAAVDAAAAFIASDLGDTMTIGDKDRLLLLRTGNSVGLALSESVFSRVRVAGKAVTELGERFRELAIDESADPSQMREIADAALEFRPSIIILQGAIDAEIRGVVEPLEVKWPQARARPRYVVAGSMEGGAFDDVRRTTQLAGRLFSTSTVFKTPANLKFTSSYNAAFNDKLPPDEAPGAPYDSLYLLAYAAYGSRKADPRGSDLVSALGRLMPPGRPRDVGPAGILDTFSELDRGGSIDLQGTYSRMDFDLVTGESPADFTIMCTKKSASGKLENIESGLVYDAAQKKMTGTFNCK